MMMVLKDGFSKQNYKLKMTKYLAFIVEYFG